MSAAFRLSLKLPISPALSASTESPIRAQTSVITPSPSIPIALTPKIDTHGRKAAIATTIMETPASLPAEDNLLIRVRNLTYEVPRVNLDADVMIPL